MSSNTALNLQVSELKNKISNLFNKFEVLQKNINVIKDLLLSSPEYSVTKDKLGELLQSSVLINNKDEIDSFYQIKEIAYEVEKIIFDLEYIIQISNNTLPKIGKAELVSNNVSLIGTLEKIEDSQNKINKIDYKLYKSKDSSNSEIKTISKITNLFNVDFEFKTTGVFYFVAVYYYVADEIGTIQSNSITSNIVTISEAVIPPTPSTTWPRGIFAPFVDAARDDINNKFAFADAAKKSGTEYYNLGFIISDAKQNPCWGGYSILEGAKGTNTGLMQDIERIRSMGGDVCISFGGLNGPYLNEIIKDDIILKNKYLDMINAWNLSRVDFDMEHNTISAGETSDANKRNHRAIKLLQNELKVAEKKVGIWFTLPVMPYGLNNNDLLVLDHAIKTGVEIEGVNIMAMCYGGAFGGNMADQAIGAMTGLHSQLRTLYSNVGISKTDSALWGMVGICPEIGVNDTGAINTFYLADVSKLLDFCKSKNVGLITLWSENRDKENNGSISASPDSTGLAQETLAFTKAFQNYNNINPLVKPLTPSNDSGLFNGTPVWHQSMRYANSGTKIYYDGNYYTNAWFIDAWENPPSSHEAWKKIS